MLRVALAQNDDPKKKRTTQPGHVDILLPDERVSPGEAARPVPVEPLSPTEERIRPPPNLPTLGRGRVFVQKAHEPAEIVVPAATPPTKTSAKKTRSTAWVWVSLLVLLLLSGGAALYLYRDLILPPPSPPKPKVIAPIDAAVRTQIAEIPPAATFFKTGPFDEQRLGDAFFAPDGRRYAFLYREGGEYGFAGAGLEKTPNGLEINGRKVHLGVATESEAGRPRLGYFESTDRFWYLVKIGEREKLILEDDQTEEFDEIGVPREAPKDKQIGFAAKRGERWFAVVGDWNSPPYDAPIYGPWFSPNGDEFSFIVGGKGDRARKGHRQLVTCSIETKTCDKRPNNPVRSIEEYLDTGNEDELFFALDWYATESSATVLENLEKMALSKRNGRWQYAVITRASASISEVPLGDGSLDLNQLMTHSKIDRPWVERFVASPDGGSIAMVVSGRSYVAGDGVVLRRSKDGEVAMSPEYVRCKFASRPFARREWLVMSGDESKIAYCTNDPAQGERVVVNEIKLRPYTYILSPPVFSPDGEVVAYFAIKERKWFLVAGPKEDGPYDELFGAPRFSADGSQVWYGARRGRTLYFVRLSLSALGQPADAAVDF